MMLNCRMIGYYKIAFRNDFISFLNSNLFNSLFEYECSYCERDYWFKLSKKREWNNFCRTLIYIRWNLRNFHCTTWFMHTYEIYRYMFCGISAILNSGYNFFKSYTISSFVSTVLSISFCVYFSSDESFTHTHINSKKAIILQLIT